MIVFGLTGGIASGKSFVAGLLAEHGAVVLDADRHAHAVLRTPEVQAALVQRWGTAIVDADGELRRGEIARRVFGTEESAFAERRYLEELVHPRVRERLEADLAAAEQGGAPAAVLDVPLLIEAGWAERCDVVLFVDTPKEFREARAAERGWSPEDLAAREAAQTPLAAKRTKADFVVPGDDEAAARKAVSTAWVQSVGS
ncbi:MAG: dephospho-CoA kinase [Planctomycetota bacterium]